MQRGGLWRDPFESTHSTPRSEVRGMPFDKLKVPSTAEGLRVDTERRFLPRFKNRGLPSTRAQAEVRRRTYQVWRWKPMHFTLSFFLPLLFWKHPFGREFSSKREFSHRVTRGRRPSPSSWKKWYWNPLPFYDMYLNSCRGRARKKWAGP